MKLLYNFTYEQNVFTFCRCFSLIELKSLAFPICPRNAGNFGACIIDEMRERREIEAIRARPCIVGLKIDSRHAASRQTGLHADRQTDRQGRQASRQASGPTATDGKAKSRARELPGSRVLLLARKLRLYSSFSILRLWYSRELPGISYAVPSKRLLFQPSGNSFNCPGRSRAL